MLRAQRGEALLRVQVLYEGYVCEHSGEAWLAFCHKDICCEHRGEASLALLKVQDYSILRICVRAQCMDRHGWRCSKCKTIKVLYIKDMRASTGRCSKCKTIKVLYIKDMRASTVERHRCRCLDPPKCKIKGVMPASTAERHR